MRSEGQLGGGQYHSTTAVISSISLQENNLQLVASLLIAARSSPLAHRSLWIPGVHEVAELAVAAC